MALNFEALTGILALNSSSWLSGIRQAQSGAGQLGQNFALVTRRISDAAQQASMAIGGIGVAIAAGSLSLVKLASELEESSSKFEYVFAAAAKKTIADLDGFSKAAGRSKYMLRDFAASFGAIIQPMGFTVDKTSELSSGLAKLAVDLSSFFNSTEDEALMALRSGIVGETEPLRRFGVVLSEAKIQSEAMASGLAKSKDKVQGAVKAQAIYNIIMRETATAQNDAQRTQGSFANQSRRVRDNIRDLATNIGNGLLPAFTETLKIFDGVIAAAAEMRPQIVELIKANLSIENVDDFWDRVFVAVNRVRGAFTNVGTAAVQLVRKFDPIRDRLQTVYDYGAKLFDSMPGWAKDLLVVGGTLGGISTALASFGMLLGPFGSVFASLAGFLNPLRMIGMAASIVGPLLSSMFLPITPIIGAVAAAAYAMYDAISSNATAATAWETIKQLAGEMWQGLKDIAKTLAGEWSKAWGDGNGELGEFSRSIGTSLLVVLAKVMGWLKQIAPYVGDVIVRAFDAAKVAVGALSETFEFAADVLTGDYSAALLKVLKLMSKVLDALDYADRAMGGSGIQIAKDMQALVAQVQAEVDVAKKAKQDMADAALQQNDVEKKIFAEEVVRNRERTNQAQAILDKMRESGAAKTKTGAANAANLQGIIAESRRAEAAGVQKIYDARKVATIAPMTTPAVEPPKPEDEFVTNERGEKRRKTAKQLADDARKREKDAADAAKKAEDLAAEEAKKKASRAGISRAAPRPGKGAALAGHASGAAHQGPATSRGEASMAGTGAEASGGAIASNVKETGKVVYDTTTGIAGDLDRLMNRSAVGISDVTVAVATRMASLIKEAQKAGEIAPNQLRSLQMAKQAATDAMLAIGNATGEQRRQAIADAAATQRAFEDAFDKITKRGKYAMENLSESEKRLEDASKKTAQSIAVEARAARQARMAGVLGAPVDPNDPNAAANAVPGQQGQPGPAAAGQPTAAGASSKRSANGPRTFGMGDLVGGITNMANGLSGMFAGAIGGGLNLSGIGSLIETIRDPIQKLTAKIDQARASLGTLAQNFHPGDRETYMLMQDVHKQLTTLESRRTRAIAQERMQQQHAVSAGSQYMREQQIAAKEQLHDILRETGLDMKSAIEIGRPGAGSAVNINMYGVTDTREQVNKIEIELRRRGFSLGAKRTLETRNVPG